MSMQEANLQITHVSVDCLKPYANNARTHSDEQITQLANSITEFGFNNPILVDSDLNVVAGHGRLMAAKQIGMTLVPTIKLEHLTDAKRKAYIIADNKLALNAGWSFDLLKTEFEALLTDNMDLALTGFSPDELNEIMFPAILNVGETDPDDVPEVKADAITRLGDVWLMGEHRLMCGDSTAVDDVNRLMNARKAELLFSSPPYSDMREYSGNDLSLDVLVTIFHAYLDRSSYYVINLGVQFKDDAVFPYWNAWLDAASGAGLKLLSWNVWDKLYSGSIAAQRRMFALQHEWLFVFGMKSKPLNRIWDKTESSTERQKYFKVNEKGQKVRLVRQRDGSMRSTVYGQDYMNKNAGTVISTYIEKERTIDHPAKYPIGLVQPYIESMTDPGQSVIDCFGGSGTTLIACEKTNRKCLMMEISPHYCDVIIKRWQKFANNTAFLEGTNISFNEMEQATNGSSRQTKMDSV